MPMPIYQTIAIVSISLFFSVQSLCQIGFYTTSPIQAKSIASKSNKHILVYHTAEWCLPCQMLEQNHFTNPDTKAIIENNYIPVKADYDHKADQVWYEKHEVRMLPTFVIYNQKGEKLKTIQNPRSVAQLQYELNKYIESNYELAIVQSNIKTYKTEGNIMLPKAQLVSSPKEVIKMPVNRTPPTYSNSRAIQFGAFTQYDNAMKLLQSLNQKSISAMIQEEKVGNITYYKVIERLSNNTHQGGKLYKYQSKGIDCFERIIN